MNREFSFCWERRKKDYWMGREFIGRKWMCRKSKCSSNVAKWAKNDIELSLYSVLSVFLWFSVQFKYNQFPKVGERNARNCDGTLLHNIKYARIKSPCGEKRKPFSEHFTNRKYKKNTRHWIGKTQNTHTHFDEYPVYNYSMANGHYFVIQLELKLARFSLFYFAVICFQFSLSHTHTYSEQVRESNIAKLFSFLQITFDINSFKIAFPPPENCFIIGRGGECAHKHIIIGIAFGMGEQEKSFN